MLEDIFNLQIFEDKAVYTWNNGNYLANRTLGVFSISLYYVDDFFTEVYFNHKTNSMGIKTYSTHRCFEPYLEKIEIGF